MAVRPSAEKHQRLALVTSAVALQPLTTGAATARFNAINPRTTNRIKMPATDPDRRRTLPRRPGQWLWQRE
jgi:non-homologous end joining protein Ku